MLRHSTSAFVALVLAWLWLTLPAWAQEKTRFIDLTSKMNRKLTDNLGSGAPGNDLSGVPTGEQTLADFRFKVGPGLIQLGSSMLPDWPEKVEGIAIDGKFKKLHFLQATCFGRGKPENQWFVKDAALVGQYQVHYEDGSIEAIAIAYGEDVRDWWYSDADKNELGRARVAWTGENGVANRYGAKLRLYAASWTNPRPEKKVTRIDYVATKGESVAAPFCLAMTVEESN